MLLLTFSIGITLSTFCTKTLECVSTIAPLLFSTSLFFTTLFSILVDSCHQHNTGWNQHRQKLLLLKNNGLVLHCVPCPACASSSTAVHPNRLRWGWCYFTFYPLLQVIVLWVHLKWWQCHYATALESRACVKGSGLCMCFVPCVAWWQQFIKCTGKVTAATLVCHLAEMTLLHSLHDLSIAPVF